MTTDNLDARERSARHCERSTGLAALLRAATYHEASLDVVEMRGVARIAADLAEDADALYDAVRAEGLKRLCQEPENDGLAAAIYRFEASHAAVKSITGPEDMPPELTDAQTEAVEALALAPCANAEELLTKIRLLIEFERGQARGGEFDISSHATIAVALDAFFSKEAQP